MFLNEKLKLANIKIEDGYKLTNAIYSAMSTDYRYWEALIQSQLKSEKKISYSKQVRQMSKTIFFVQDIISSNVNISKKKLQLLNEFTWLYSGTSACFHAKLAILRYEKKRDDIDDEAAVAYLIAVMSKNMVCNDFDDQNIIWHWSRVKPESEIKASDNGSKLWKYISYCADNCKKNIYGEAKNPPSVEAFNDIQYIENDNFDIFFNGIDNNKLSAELFEKPFYRLKAVCKSYFVGESYRALAADSDLQLSVYTKYKVNDKGIECDNTHMKLFFKTAADNKSYFYSGSANLSESALSGNNVECLVRIEISEEDIQTIIGNLEKNDYHITDRYWPGLIQPADERSEENEVIGSILGMGWKWAVTADSEFYIADKEGKKAVPAKYQHGKDSSWIYEIIPISFYENYGENSSDMLQKPEDAVLLLRKEPDYSVCQIKGFRPTIEESLNTSYEDFDFDKEYKRACMEEVNKAKRIISECYKVKTEEQYKKQSDRIESLDPDALDEAAADDSEKSVKKSLEELKRQLKLVWERHDDGN